jgi:hypothetical protein
MSPSRQATRRSSTGSYEREAATGSMGTPVLFAVMGIPRDRNRRRVTVA